MTAEQIGKLKDLCDGEDRPLRGRVPGGCVCGSGPLSLAAVMRPVKMRVTV
jgi:hypothetical protein